MLCQNCGINNATSHIHSVVNGVVHDKYLCSDCAVKFKTASFSDDGLLKALTSLLSDDKTNVSDVVQKCDCCGTTLNDISRSGRVGCCNCYKIFQKHLIPTLVRIHGRTSHVGKKPYKCDAIADQSAENNNKIDQLKKELSTAVANEEYEKAAVLRDEIKLLEEK